MVDALAKVLADALADPLSRWSLRRERSILKTGKLLDPDALEFAGRLGIDHPEQLRIEQVERVPMPVSDRVMDLAAAVGLPVFQASGMALGRGISVTRADDALVRHELVHVLQYQRLGGHRGFMWRYVYECARFGYLASDLEKEARSRANL